MGFNSVVGIAMPQDIYQLAKAVGQQLQARHWQLALAESCTGGGIAQAVTDVAGSSAWFDRGFVTYSNAAKVEMLGVKQHTLNQFGAVSAETVLEMVAGALQHSHADLAFAVTGIAGPDGGTLDKPIGTVFIAWQFRGRAACYVKQLFSGDRLAVRQQVIVFCLQQAYALMAGES
ncbi:CinA family protein [Methylomonas lenta]|nr:CinA family protein [Methylomonas lenta]